MEQFEQILLKYDCLKRIEKSKTTIEEIENIIKFKLPLDYKAYLQNYLGFEENIGPEFIRLWDIDELIKLNKDYAIWDSLPMTLGIGDNGNNEFIAIEIRDKDNLRIVLSPLIDLDKNEHIEIGASFTDFLIRLEIGQAWFEKKTNHKF